MKNKLLNILLIISLIITLMVPVTGIIIHKLAATVFLVLCIIHTIINRKRLKGKKYGILAIVIIDFVSGILGMIMDNIPVVLNLHKVISIATVFILAIHIFVYYSHRKK